jgi:hypothetical protein
VRSAKLVVTLSLFIPTLIPFARAQVAGGTVSGVVTGPVGNAPVSNAKISVKNTASGQTAQAQSGPNGNYSVTSLTPGTYEITVTADGLGSKTQQITLIAGAAQTVNVGLPAATPGGAGAPSLGDLGFPTAQTQADPKTQALLDRRSHMLMVHQRMGLITGAALAATLISSGGAGGKSTSSTSRDLHAALGITTAGLYFTTASYAIRAPRIAGTSTRGPIKWHKGLAWVHGTGMVLTPILGAMAFDQKSKGEKVHGIASYHGAVAWTTGIAYGLAIATVSFKF